MYVTFICGELTAADHAHFSPASSGDGHTLFLSYSGVICKYDYSDWLTIFTSFAMTVCVCVCACMRACMCGGVHMHASMHACVCACVCVRARVCVICIHATL